MNHEHISHMLPDFIHGTLQPEDHSVVQKAIADSKELQQEYHELQQVFNALKKDDIIQLMHEEAASVSIFVPMDIKKKLFIPKILIGATTSIAACLLLWIGISKQSNDSHLKRESRDISTAHLADILDEYSTLELQSDEVEEVILDDILTVYVSDIETGKEINPLLEEEITNFLLQENQEDEAL